MNDQGTRDHHVILAPRAPFLLWWDWDGATARERQRRMPADVPISGWSLPARPEGVTLGSLLSWIRRLSRPSLSVLERLCRSNIGPYLAEKPTPAAVNSGDRPAIAFIEIGKTIFIEKAFDRRPRDAEVDVRVDCSGLEAPVAGRRHTAVRWAIDLMPVPTLASAVLTVAEKGYVVESRRRPEAAIATFTPQLTLGEILTALFGEIAGHGSPAARESWRRELARRSEEARSGQTRPYTWAEVKADLAKQRARDAKHAAARARRRQLRERRLWQERHPGETPIATAAPRLALPSLWDLRNRPIGYS